MEFLPLEIQRKIFYFLEHPCAGIIKQAFNNYKHKVLFYDAYYYSHPHFNFKNSEIYWNSLLGNLQWERKIYEEKRLLRELDAMDCNNFDIN